MPRRSALQGARVLTWRQLELRVLMLSMYDVADYFLESIHGASISADRRPRSNVAPH
jgi:hypothetical protein